MFEELNVTDAFKNSITKAIEKRMLSHALILEGADEKTRLFAAKEIAAAMLCREAERPCGSCSSCKKMQADSHPDLHIIKKEDKSSMIKVDAVRELKKKALVFPNESEKSVFIIDGAETMNPQAQNALLKIFEEPSEHLLFILCCKTKASLLDTIISRATAYSLGRDSVSAEKNDKEKKAEALACELMEVFVDESEVNFLKKIAVLQKNKELFRLTLEQIKILLRDSLVIQSGSKQLLSGKDETAKKLAKKLTARKINTLYKASQELYNSSVQNANQNLTITRFSSLFYSIKTGQ